MPLPGQVIQISGMPSLVNRLYRLSTLRVNPVNFWGVAEVSSGGSAEETLGATPHRWTKSQAYTLRNAPSTICSMYQLCPPSRTRDSSDAHDIYTQLAAGLQEGLDDIRSVAGGLGGSGMPAEAGASDLVKELRQQSVEWFSRSHLEECCRLWISIHVYAEGPWELAMTDSNLVVARVKGSHIPPIYAFNVSFALVSNCARGRHRDFEGEGSWDGALTLSARTAQVLC
ncbi:hypothetical protein BKA70DRAFT_1441701 [Coprinopsis sp. MPI-PUGE-AT-0042]|nr:hypothetical protein BKA70DRAFT_1441701 [Coprinopsis sp. MPI-PUGE-AT-0042]